VLRAVGLTSTLHLPDYSVVTVKALVSLLCTGKAVLPCTAALEEFISFSNLLSIKFITGQVTRRFLLVLSASNNLYTQDLVIRPV
jgi:hypothetical protein